MLQSEQLFGAVENPHSGRKPYDMKLYEFFSRSDRKEVANLREFWNQIFESCTLPLETKNEIRARFRDKSDDNHLGALFELFMYEFLTRSGHQVASGPRLISGQPDFKVATTGGIEFLVEATCILGVFRSTEQERKKEIIHDTIDSIQSDRFRVALSIKGKIGREIKRKSLRHEVEGWLRGLDYDEVLGQQRGRGGILNCDEKCISVAGSKIYLRPHALIQQTSDADSGLVILGSIGGMYRVITGEYIRKKLRQKVKQIKDSDLPVLLAVNVLEPFLDDDDVLGGLFGELKSIVPMGRITQNFGENRRGTDGAWMQHGKPRNRKIEAVMFFASVGHDATPVKEPMLVANPFVKPRRLPPSFPFVNHVVPSEDGLNLTSINPKDGNTDRQNNSWRESWPFKFDFIAG